MRKQGQTSSHQRLSTVFNQAVQVDVLFIFDLAILHLC